MSNIQTLIPSEVFRARMRETRDALGLKQRELVDLVAPLGGPTHQPAIARIEAGTRKASLDEAFAIAAGLGVELGYLCSPEPEPPTWTDYLVRQAERSPEEVAQERAAPLTQGGRMAQAKAIQIRRGRREQIKQLVESIQVSKAFIEEVSDEEPEQAEEERRYMARLQGRLDVLRELEAAA